MTFRLSQEYFEDTPVGIVATHEDINKGLDVKGSLIAHSFITNFRGEQDMHPVPSQLSDHYLYQALLSYPLGSNPELERTVLFNLMHGHRGFYNQIGLDNSTERHIVFEQKKQFENLEQRLLDEIKANESYYRELLGTLAYLPVFPTQHISAEIADRVGMNLLVSERTGFMANNKAALREFGPRYGLKVPNGMQFLSIEKVDFDSKIAEMLEFTCDSVLSGKDIWVKYPTGSGGDLVQPIKVSKFGNSSRAEIEAEFRRILATFTSEVLKSRSGEDSQPDLETVKTVISRGGLVVEEGLQPGFSNYNAQVIIGAKGRVTAINFSEQLTSSTGEYLGNQIKPLSEYREGTNGLIWMAMGQIADYLYKEYSANMIVGADILITPSNEVYVIDINARPNGSTSQKLLAAKLGANYSLNINLKLPIVPNTYYDIINCVGSELLYGQENGKGVIPQMPRRTTGIVKSSVIADSIDEIDEYKAKLRAKGINL